MEITLSKLLKLKDFYSLSKIAKILSRELIFYFNQKILPTKYLECNVYNYKMIIPVKIDGIGRVLFTRGERELDHKYIMEKEVKPGYNILDLGANIGYYVLLENMLMQGKGKITAIEPDYRNIELLKKNIDINNIECEVEIIEGAISDKEGNFTFYLASKTNLSSFNITENHEQFEARTVKSYNFETFCQKYEKFNLVRMDIEGHEVEIFNSLLKLIESEPSKAPDKIIFETHKTKYNNEHNIKYPLERLFSRGYYPKYISTADENISKLHSLGYKPFLEIKDFPFIRGIYKNIKKDDAIKLISDLGSVRTVLIEKNSND